MPISWHPGIPGGANANALCIYRTTIRFPGNAIRHGRLWLAFGCGASYDAACLIRHLRQAPELGGICGPCGAGCRIYARPHGSDRPSGTTGLKKKVSAYFHESIWYTPSGILSKSSLNIWSRCSERSISSGRWITPYVPFQTCSTEFLMNADLTDEQKEMIAYKNAEKMLKL